MTNKDYLIMLEDTLKFSILLSGRKTLSDSSEEINIIIRLLKQEIARIKFLRTA